MNFQNGAKVKVTQDQTDGTDTLPAGSVGTVVNSHDFGRGVVMYMVDFGAQGYWPIPESELSPAP